MNIIRARIERLLSVTNRSSTLRRKKTKSRLRGAYKKGVLRYSKELTIRVTPETLERLDRLCNFLHVERGLLSRDALDFYTKIAETEFLAEQEGPKHKNYYAQPTAVAGAKSDT